MNSKQTDYSEKIKWYLKGELPKAEEKMLVEWLNESPENYTLFQAIVRENEFKIAATEDTDRAWERFRRHINETSSKKQHKSLFIHHLWVRAAAVLLLVILTGILGKSYLDKKQTDKQLCELCVPYGEKKQLDLSDGSKIWLNAGTKLRYPRKFSGENRSIEIDGEAYFEVTKDKSHPFVITTPNFEVKVLGTTFNLSTYREDENNSLSLLTGSVQLATNDHKQKIMLVPGEKAVLNKSSKSIQIVPIDSNNSASWRNDTLEFKNISLIEISKVLERRFNVKIQIKKDELRQIKFSGRFVAAEGIDELLSIMKQIAPTRMNYKHTNKEEIIIE